ncbi:MAG: phage head closure protein [Kordiimonadaceae bacterium]|nr:phage head closure protein [Kordiimonadaceae bacterium]
MAYNHKISLVKKTETQGPGGRKTFENSVIARPWASMVTKKHAPVARGEKLEFPVSVTFKVRYSEKYYGANHITKGGRVFTIISRENPDEKNREIVFWCKEKLANVS